MMIRLTRLGGSSLFVNADLVQWLESTPDTVVTLVNGEKLVVAEPLSVVVGRIHSRRRRLARLGLAGAPYSRSIPAVTATRP